MRDEPILCPYCGKPAEWVENKTIYGRNYGKSYMVWFCRADDAYVGCHQNTKQALGTMADAALREMRKRAHSVIDPLWKSGKYKRKTVYIRLKEAFGEEIHVGESDKTRCEEIIKTVPLIFQK